MVHYASDTPTTRGTEIGPDRCIVIGRGGEIKVEYITADGFISYRAPVSGELSLAKQLTWWASDANPLRSGRAFVRPDGLTVRGWLAASLQGTYWIVVEVTDAEGRTLPGASIIPRDAEISAYVRALLTVAVSSPSTSTDRLPAAWLV